MSKERNQWLISQIIYDAFIIYSSTWIVLFLMELVKEGIVSNYISLTHMAIIIPILGITYLFIAPESVAIKSNKKLSKLTEYSLLLVILLIDCLFILLYLDISLFLRIVLILLTITSIVTVYSLYTSEDI